MDGLGAAFTGLSGYVAKINGDGESVTWYFDDGGNKEKKAHQSKVYFSRTGKPYFRARGLIIYMDEVLRIEMPDTPGPN